MSRKKQKEEILEDNPLWYKDAVIYELHVRAFYDTNGDGIGDFRGLAEKLDYLQDLGVTALWLLPFYPSPLRDDGYDISDYTNIHPIYGNLPDFKLFLREAHRRGLRVITELVVNHTSDQHPWFQRARQAAPGSAARDFYVWSDTPEKYKETRIIFKDFEPSNWAWDPVANAYYWHRFYAHQPDLNFDNPEVRKTIFQLLDFWLGMGIDGLRLDAVPYLFEREGTNCENLPETHQYLKDLRRHVDKNFSNRMLLAEANQWPEDAVAYLGDGDECHMAFHFPVMPRLFMAIRMEDRFPIIDILQQTPPIPDNSQWALFLRNHDELTLEMVTDEDRDYMYRVYAHDPQARINLGIRRRLAPLLGNNRRKIELMNGLLFSLPGTPVVYYGDEIGMGDNIYLGDRNGVRTPMQWSPDRNAGFSRANPQRLYLPVIIDPEYQYEAINVEAQQNNPHSLLWWMKRLIDLRKRFKAFGHGSIEFLHPENRKVLAYLRRYQEQTIFVVANLSRFVQFVDLDLSDFKGLVPVELFGRTKFPAIGEQPYFLTLGPHTFYWFALESERVDTTAAAEAQLPALSVRGAWENVFRGKAKAMLEEALPHYLMARRWFGGKARQIKGTNILDTFAVTAASSTSHIALVEVEYIEGDPQIYVLPLNFVAGRRAAQTQDRLPHAVIARLQVREQNEGAKQEGILYDALSDTEFSEELLDAIKRRRRFKGDSGEIVASHTPAFRQLRGPRESFPEPSIMKAEQSNTSIVYGDRLILKIYRRLEEGINPDLEIGRFLTERVSFKNTPPVAGAIEYNSNGGTPMTVGLLMGFVENEGDAWQYTLDSLGRYFERVLTRRSDVEYLPKPYGSLLEYTDEELTPQVRELIGYYIESARLLGQRTAELHIALDSAPDDPNFAPEPFTPHYQRSIYQSMRSLATQVFDLLRKQFKNLPLAAHEEARRVIDLEEELRGRLRAVTDRKITANRIRTHGDYHLGQVLYTGKDFVIIDFEGEPARPLSERRLKRSPLRDVAGMLRSFHYAAAMVCFDLTPRPEDFAAMQSWAHFWQVWVSAVFLRAYFKTAAQASFLPQTPEEVQTLLEAYLLEKAVYELGYELNNRPDWVRIPLEGILQLLQPAR